MDKNKMKRLNNTSVAKNETTNVKDQYILHIFFVLQGKSMGELEVVLHVAHCVLTISELFHGGRAIMKCLNAYELDFKNMAGFVSDNAIYMVYNDILQGFLQNSVHLTCKPHILALVSNIWPNNLTVCCENVVHK